AGVLTMFAGIGLLLDYSSLSDVNRNRVVAPRQQTAMGSLTAGPVGRNSYRYDFRVSDKEYSDWGTMQGPEPKIGQPVLVYYDPENPGINALARFEYSNSQRALDVVLGIVILSFITVLIPVCMIGARMRRNRSPETI